MNIIGGGRIGGEGGGIGDGSGETRGSGKKTSSSHFTNNAKGNFRDVLGDHQKLADPQDQLMFNGVLSAEDILLRGGGEVHGRGNGNGRGDIMMMEASDAPSSLHNPNQAGRVSHQSWPESNYSYSDNEKQLLEEMRRMKKEHQNVLRTYEGRVNKLMAKMHELRNIAEMLEHSSNKSSPFGALPAKIALLNILGKFK